MSTYSVTRKSDSVEVYRYSADAPIEWTGFEFAEHDHTEYVEPPAPEQPPSPLPQVRISRLAFLNRFTDPEAIGIDLASQGATVQAAAMRRYTNRVNAAEFIDLNRAETRSGVLALESVGLLAPGRALVILGTEPTEEERFRG